MTPRQNVPFLKIKDAKTYTKQFNTNMLENYFPIQFKKYDKNLNHI